MTTMNQDRGSLALEDALRVRSAEMWLDVGEPDQALQELQRLSAKAWTHQWAKDVLEVACKRSGRTTAEVVA